MPDKLHSVSIAAIFKNEAPYILEWVAYHRAIGVDWFYIADNNSDDGTTQILATLASAGIVTHIPFPGSPETAPQLPAYENIIRHYAKETEWMGFIDADEFILPTDGSRTVAGFFERLAGNKDVGAVALNWATYGSSGHKNVAPGLVIERFTQRAPDDFIANYHHKVFVRTDAKPTTRGTPHLFTLAAGFRTVTASIRPLGKHPERGEGLSSSVDWNNLRLNHYVTKSSEEFYRRKGPKGRATVVGEKKGEGYFIHHDRNEVADPTPSWLVEATRAELQSLAKSTGLTEAPPPLSPLVGHIDAVTADVRGVRVVGWLLSNQEDTPRIRIGDTIVEEGVLNRIDRPDVVRHYPNAPLNCGFSIFVDASAIDDTLAGKPVGVSASNFQVIHSDFIWPAAANSLDDLSSDVEAGDTNPSFRSPPSIAIAPAKLGNLLFRYMLAERIREELPEAEIEGIDIPEFGLQSSFVAKPAKVPFVTPTQQAVDVTRVAYRLRSGINDGVVLNSYGQRMEYFQHRRLEFDQLLHSDRTGASVADNEIVINIRTAEIIDGIHPDYFPLPINYYKHLVHSTGLKPLFVGQVAKGDYVDALCSAFPDARFIAHDEWIDDFQTIRNARNIAIAVSTFSWLAAWLSKPTSTIHFPLIGLLNPLQRPDVDLCPVSDDRYVFYRFPYLKYTGTPEQKIALISGGLSFAKIGPSVVKSMLRQGVN